MNPWDDDLRLAGQGQARALVSDSDGRMVAVLRTLDAEQWEALLLAAPKMARALRMVLEQCGNARWIDDTGLPRDAKKEIAALLIEAGVDLP